MVDGERIYGDGVNIAARMEGLAEGGGICVSGMVFEQVKGKVSVGFEDLGLQQVKNIAGSIRAYRAVLGSGTVSAEPQKKVEVPRQDLRETSNRYDRLTSRLSPLLYRGIDDVLLRWKKTLKSAGDLNFVVVAPINGFYRSVGGSGPAEDPERQNSTKVGEGIRGFFTERKVAGYVRSSASLQSKEGNRTVFDRAGQVFAEFPVGRPANILAPSVGTKWNYFRPIFEKSTANPWSDRVIGLFIVFASADNADSLFKSAKFQRMVDSVASELSPYLDAIQVLTGEEKL